MSWDKLWFSLNYRWGGYKHWIITLQYPFDPTLHDVCINLIAASRPNVIVLNSLHVYRDVHERPRLLSVETIFILRPPGEQSSIPIMATSTQPTPTSSPPLQASVKPHFLLTHTCLGLVTAAWHPTSTLGRIEQCENDRISIWQPLD